MPLLGVVLWVTLLTLGWRVAHTKDYVFATPRVQLSFKELKATSTAHFFNFLLNSTDYRILLKDEDHDRMYVGSKDYILSLDLHDINREPLIAFALTQSVQLGGRGSRAADSSHSLTPAERKDYIFYLEPEKLESGKGKCSYDPKVDSVSALINEELYAGVYIDFMGTDAAIFRTMGKQTAMRTDQYNSRWLNDPAFVHAQLIPDSAERNDDKLYFFFREKSADAPQSPAVYSRIGRICLNDDGGHCCLVNKWSTFLKARLICSVPGPDGIETHFDELQDVFIQQTQDVKNPIIYAVFAASGSVFKGSAVCVYSMADIRMVFNGPFAHKEGPNYQWMPYTGKMPYPRPGTCPGGTFTPSMKSTKDYPDEVINFMRSHPLMYHAVYPVHRQPLVVRSNVHYKFTTVAVDQVDAADGRYEVLFLGTDRGTVQKVIVLPKDDLETEELMLEEVEVFKVPAPIKTMTISSKRQQLYVASAIGVTHLALHRCDVYGEACADCCLARDPYCAWDGKACSRYSASSKRRSRRQDVRHGNPIRQCRGYNSNANKNTVEAVQYGVEGSTAFLECQPRSPQATVKWLLQKDNSDRRKELRMEGRVLRTEQGLLLRSLQLSDSGLYSCTATENNFKHTVAKVQLHVLSSETVHSVLFQSEAPALQADGDVSSSVLGMRAGLPGAPSPHYQDLVQLLTQPEMGLINQYCQGYWRHAASSHKEALANLKAKELQDEKKPRNRRNHQPDVDQLT
ncbi:semaphorin-3F isoform X3 [Mauremys reevesii]|uniref:semaphorin-3F isoform X3 n=1 Tax=Mauremys reevesii TaxID=260615 RepID=UPI00193F3D05|nr:semaphorin-3F isoform X3 [Mauremys reevesii]